MFFFQIKQYEKLECPDERRKLAREIYDDFIMKELLAHTHVSNIILHFIIMIHHHHPSIVQWSIKYYIITVHYIQNSRR